MGGRGGETDGAKDGSAPDSLEAKWDEARDRSADGAFFGTGAPPGVTNSSEIG
jgi:hypothetical protein